MTADQGCSAFGGVSDAELREVGLTGLEGHAVAHHRPVLAGSSGRQPAMTDQPCGRVSPPSGLDIRSAPPRTAIASARTVVRVPPGVWGRRPTLPARPASHTHPERTASVVDMPGTAPWRPRRRPSSIGLDRAHTRRL